MSRRTVSALTIWAFGLSASLATAADAPPIGRLVGQRVADFSLDDVTTGRSVSLYGHRGRTEAVVLVFTGTDCPLGNLYMPRLVELAGRYEGRKVAFLAINANAHETAEQVAAHAKEHGLTIPVLKDQGNVVADQLLVERTCEALVIDARARLRYRGAIDDQYGVGVHRGQPRQTFLTDALDAMLSGRPVETTATTVDGCLIDRAEVKAAARKSPRIRAASPVIVEALNAKEGPVEVGRVTYAADVATILQNKCQACHRPKQAAPFALLDYDDARRWAATIREVVDERRMPPWHADPRHGRFENDRSLTARERATLLAWVDQGAPLGDPSDLPAARAWPEGWSVGEPDAVFTMPEPFTVSAQGEVVYQYFRIPTGFTEDTWVQSIEARPGDRAVVHHIIAYLDDKSGRNFRSNHLGGYAPGDMPSVYPPGIAKKIPAGSDLVLQVHYTPMGKIKTDRSSVGLIFAKEPPTHQAITLGIANARFAIPPGKPSHEVKSRFAVPADSRLLSFMPHMHLRGKDFQYTATYPDGRREVLLSVPAYDFAWQSYYRLAVPKVLPKGTVIDCVAHFDNSADNPSNPDPTQTVRWGDQTWEEMMIGYIDFVPDTPLDAPLVRPRAAASSGTATGLGRALRLLRREAVRGGVEGGR